MSRWSLGLSLCVAFFGGGAHALPADSLHLRLPDEASPSPWSASVFYHFAPVDAGIGLRAELGFQLAKTLDARSTALLHVQSDSLLLGYARLWRPVFSAPTRWVVGVDLRSPFSYLVEGQMFFPVGRLQPFLNLRVQSTGYSVEGGDGGLFDKGSAVRFWLGSAAVGAGYALHPDLRVAASFTYRAALGSTDFKDPGVFHLSLQWLWGADKTP